MAGNTTFVKGVSQRIYCSEGTQVAPARPSGKGRPEARKSVG